MGGNDEDAGEGAEAEQFIPAYPGLSNEAPGILYSTDRRTRHVPCGAALKPCDQPHRLD